LPAARSGIASNTLAWPIFSNVLIDGSRPLLFGTLYAPNARQHAARFLPTSHSISNGILPARSSSSDALTMAALLRSSVIDFSSIRTGLIVSFVARSISISDAFVSLLSVAVTPQINPF
jgi:hypothetical protein